MKYGTLAVFCAAIMLTSCSTPATTPSNTEDRSVARSNTTLVAQITDGAPSVTIEEGTASTGVQIVTDGEGHIYPSVVVTTENSTDIATTARRSDSTFVKPSTTIRWTAESTAPATTTANPSATTTALQPADPWRYPYNLPAIYADCKREIERLGMVWQEELRPENCAWANPESTIPNTYYPDDCYLRDDVFEMIRFYHEINTRRYCRIWFVPEPDSPGDYRFYFLEEY